MTVETVTSKDGTDVACLRSGEGPPLVLLPGITGDHTHFAGVAPLLEPHFSLWIVQRRGRPPSGDNPAYAIEREFEDVAAVLDATDEPANVFGHSFGATLVLGAMPQARNLRRAVLYEPYAGVGPRTPDVDRDAMPEDLDLHHRLTVVETISREIRAQAEWSFSPDADRSAIPALLLVGSESPAVAHRAAERAHAVLPNGRISVLQGQDHDAMWTDPELVARILVEFFLEAPHASAGAP